jgi:signal transduction histidine kinase
MTRRRPSGLTGRLATWLAAGVCVSLGILIWFGYAGVREWQRSEELLADRRARETVDLLLTALSRDMRGVQQRILSEWWEELTVEPPDEVRSVVASAFARYPYPESFFAWRHGADDAAMSFFNRSDRPPLWMVLEPVANPFPVTIGHHPAVARTVLERLQADARQGRRFSAFETALGSGRYQIVARLFYRDAFREELDGIAGFTVNLRWAREHYFPEMASQVARMGPGLPVAIVDAGGRTVAGTVRDEHQGPIVRRWFPVLFIDPLLVGVDSPADVSQEFWAVQVGVGDDSAVGGAAASANRALLFGAVAAITLVVGLLLTVRAARASARVAGMRSDFVSTVTHELKTPLSTIRAAGETLARGRIADPGAQRDYAQLVVQESKRLGRLVENLLAYSRVTDVTEVYAFEPLDLDALVGDVLKGFRAQLESGGFELQLEIPADLPRIRGDRTALGLMLDNVVDNALRYSDAERWLRIRARRDPPRKVLLEVSDRGVGIAASEVGHVARKFFRGRGARPGGSGLGLAIVSRIAADHGGTLAIASQPGAGTTVSITIPEAG